MIPLQSNSLFRHLFPFYSPCNDPFWWITPHQNQSFNSWVKQSSSTLYFYHSSTHKIRSYPREVAHWFITYLAMGKTHITPNYCYSNKQVLSHSIHLPTNHIPIILTTLQQLLVCSLSRYHTIVNHEDDIHNRAQTMCHHSRMILSPRLQRRQELLLMLTVQRTRRFVQKKDRGIAITPNAASDLPTPPFPQLPDRYRIDRASRC